MKNSIKLSVFFSLLVSSYIHTQDSSVEKTLALLERSQLVKACQNQCGLVRYQSKFHKQAFDDQAVREWSDALAPLCTTIKQEYPSLGAQADNLLRANHDFFTILKKMDQCRLSHQQRTYRVVDFNHDELSTLVKELNGIKKTLKKPFSIKLIRSAAEKVVDTVRGYLESWIKETEKDVAYYKKEAAAYKKDIDTRTRQGMK